MDSFGWSRRGLMGAGLAVAMGPCAWAEPRDRDIVFQVWRKDVMIGSHRVRLRTAGGDVTALIDAQFVVKIGPIPVYRYHHQAAEVWKGGRFVSFDSQTLTNGKREQVKAMRSAEGSAILIDADRKWSAPGDAHPLTHWNSAVLEGPLFNPQTGLPVHVHVAEAKDQTVRLADGRSIPATRYTLTGEVDMVDWYDQEDVWVGLRGKAPDGSYIEYRRT